MGDFSSNQDWHAVSSFINNEHDKLISLVNQLQEAVLQGQDKGIMETVLNELIRYTGDHFGRKDTPMPKTPYSGAAAQPMEHDKCHWITI